MPRVTPRSFAVLPDAITAAVFLSGWNAPSIAQRQQVAALPHACPEGQRARRIGSFLGAAKRTEAQR